MGLLTGLAGLVTSAGTGAGIPPPSATPDNNRNNITVAPVGVNLGAIIQPYRENPLAGGYGFSGNADAVYSGLSTVKAPSSYVGTSLETVQAKLTAKDSGVPLAIAGVVVLVAVAAIAAKKR